MDRRRAEAARADRIVNDFVVWNMVDVRNDPKG